MVNKWWENSEVIQTKVPGVFEAGGAKVVAYVDPLNAMKKGDVGSMPWSDLLQAP